MDRCDGTDATGNAVWAMFVAQLSKQSTLAPKLGEYIGRLGRLLGIVDIDLHIEEVTARTSRWTWWLKSSTR